MKTVLDWLQNTVVSIFPYDKTLHYLAGLLIFLISHLLTHNIYISVGIVVGMAFLKEVCDNWIRKSVFDIKDAVYTIFGGLTGMGYVLLA